MKFVDILTLIDEKNANFTLLLCHNNADPDSIGSAYALQSLLKKLRPSLRVVIGTKEGINRLSKRVLKYVPIPFDPNPNIDDADVIILLDANTVQQLGNLTDKLMASQSPIIIIDHHAIHPNTKLIAKISITDELSPSTCEIVYKFYKEQNIKPSLNVANALFMGIVTDTRHFILGNASTFKTVSELSEIGVNPKEALNFLSIPVRFSERIARLKACRRAQLITIDKWIISFSNVSSYQASAARAFIDLGAHIAIVAGQKSDKIKMSLRCSKEFNKKTGMHIGKDIAQPLGKYLQGIGGGHALAAGLNGIGKVENALNQCLVIIRNYLSN